MKRITILTFHKDYESQLGNLKEVGLLHIKEKQNKSDSTSTENEALLTALNGIKAVEATLAKQKGDAPETTDATKTSGSTLSGVEIVDRVEELCSKQESIKHNIDLNKKDMELYEPWGSINYDRLEALKEAGLPISFYSTTTKVWESSGESEADLFKISTERTRTNFIAVGSTTVNLDAEEILLPQRTASEISAETVDLESNFKSIQEELLTLAATSEASLSLYRDELRESLDLHNAKLNTEWMLENRLTLLEGYAPAARVSEITELLDKDGSYYEIAEPTLTESVPVQLKNNKVVKLFENIGALYSLPRYGELDLTPYFAPFYWLFFGFCLGDAGYGAILLIGALIMRKRVAADMKGMINLAALLGLSTLIFGTITGNVFGISLFDEGVGAWGRFAAEQKAAGTPFSINSSLFNLSIILGVIQIIFGMVVQVLNKVKQLGFKYALSTIGWLVLIVGGGTLYGLESADMVTPELATPINYGILGVWFLTVFPFSNPDGNIIKNIGAGIWSTYNMGTGMMGDVLSYIRLFALGISSSILALVFNSLAVAFAPDNIIGKVVVMTIVLLVGHGINLFMAILGSFVHPVRLTFVEFYKNAGFEGGGKAYNPFKKRI